MRYVNTSLIQIILSMFFVAVSVFVLAALMIPGVLDQALVTLDHARLTLGIVAPGYGFFTFAGSYFRRRRR